MKVSRNNLKATRNAISVAETSTNVHLAQPEMLLAINVESRAILNQYVNPHR